MHSIMYAAHSYCACCSSEEAPELQTEGDGAVGQWVMVDWAQQVVGQGVRGGRVQPGSASFPAMPVAGLSTALLSQTTSSDIFLFI